MSDYVCSNCGELAAIDSRMGAVNHYLMCECVSQKNSRWINDGRGGYTTYLNDARPVPLSEYKGGIYSRSGDSAKPNKGWVCPKCNRGLAPSVKYCNCKLK